MVFGSPGCGEVVAIHRGERRSLQSVVVRLEGDDEKILFTVRDEGCGMDQEVRRLAFTNFFTTKGAGGTGLGLLLTRKITQEHGGRIEFESEPGRGTTFRLTFPRSRLPEPGMHESEESGQQQPMGEKT